MPVRCCTSCRGRDEKSNLFRFVLRQEGDRLKLHWDTLAVDPGRGAYLHPSLRCLSAKGAQERLLAQLLKTDAGRAADLNEGGPQKGKRIERFSGSLEGYVLEAMKEFECGKFSTKATQKLRAVRQLCETLNREHARLAETRNAKPESKRKHIRL